MSNESVAMHNSQLSVANCQRFRHDQLALIAAAVRAVGEFLRFIGEPGVVPTFRAGITEEFDFSFAFHVVHELDFGVVQPGPTAEFRRWRN